MGTARQDFERFVQWLHEPERGTPEAALRFANLVLANFDAVAETARQHNNRSHLLARLAREHLEGFSPARPRSQEVVVPHGEWPWGRLRSLTLGPFRGFREPQRFDLRKRVVLCYGPNGSGKSSFCEALEYALCGTVEEAGQRRIPDREFLANIHAGRFVEPVLTAIDRGGNEVPVRVDEDAFRFFFIERNRIENFSRMAAAPPGRRNDLIATLFGMDRFNEFVSRFNESMDAALVLGMPAQMQLQTRRQLLATDGTTVAREAERLEEIDQEAADYAAGFLPGLTYKGLKALVGSEEAPGRLQELNAKLSAVPPTAIGISRESLAGLYAKARESTDRVAIAERLLSERSSQVSFRDMYVAVQALRTVDAERCPACLTPLAEVTQDPFDRAEAGLQQLAELATLETQHQSMSREREAAERALLTELGKLREFLEGTDLRDSIVCGYVQGLPTDLGTPGWWMSVYAPATERPAGVPSLEQLLEAADIARARDVQTRDMLAARDIELQEQRKLNDARVWMAAHETKRTGAVDDAQKARTRIAEWEGANADVITRAAREADENRRDRPIKEAYDSFYGFLDHFRDQLPGMLMADLNATTMELYNEFNHEDREEDKLCELRLPHTGEGMIEIAFRGNPDRRLNALTTLSEGHIRCLGLAILLAKAQSIGAPLIIFDDAINAIDHDHRGGIRAAIFESERFSQTQIIVTCHSPEFVKDIQNHLPQAVRNDCQQFVLLHHDGDYQPRVIPDVGSANYLSRAREAMGRFDPRDALSNARKALEMLMQKAWKWLESHRIGNISVQIEGPGKEPQLRMLCEALRSKLRGTATFVHDSKEALVDCLNTILGIPEQTLVWTLLNKGAHEEHNRDDFDRNQVEAVLNVLERIDMLELRPGR